MATTKPKNHAGRISGAAIQYVVKAGTLYDGMSLDQLWPKAVPFGPNYWVSEDMLQMNIKRSDAHDARRPR